MGISFFFGLALYSAYLYGKRGQETQVTLLPTPTLTLTVTPLFTPTWTPVITAFTPAVFSQDICEKEKEAIQAIVTNFENLQKDKKAREVLALFTPPVTPDEIGTYEHLSGSDAAGPRLYSSGQTNFLEHSYEIIEEPKMNASGTCAVSVKEERQYYHQGIGGYMPKGWVTVYFVFKKEDKAWLIDKYLDSGGSTGKYSGWAY